MPTSARRYGSSSRLVPRSGERAASAVRSGDVVRVARRQRQLGAQRVDLAQVVLERDRRLPLGRVLRDRGGDVRVAVAIAADPARRRAGTAPRAPPAPGRPPARRRSAGSRRGTSSENTPGRSRSRRRRSASTAAARWSSRGSGSRAAAPSRSRRSRFGHRAATRRQQRDDRAVPVEDALALHLGRVRGQHRLDARAFEERDQLARVRDVRGPQPFQRLARSSPRPARGRRRAVQILGGVRQVVEIAERAHD